MARATVDIDKCQGHARCSLVAPEVFDVDDDGLAYVLVDEVPDDHLADVREAVRNCPEEAIGLRD